MFAERILIQQAKGAARFPELCGIDYEDCVGLGKLAHQPETQRPAVNCAQARWCVRVARKSARHMDADPVVSEQSVSQPKHENALRALPGRRE
jgi:hypothetical protein